MTAPATQDWRALPAGNALDAVIEQRVFGKATTRTGGTYYAVRKDGGGTHWCAVRPYSTDLSAALHVVEKLHALVFVSGSSAGAHDPWPHANYLTLSCRGLGAQQAGWAAAFTCVAFDEESLEWVDAPEQYGGAVGEAPALAICRAALAALEIAP